MASACGSESEQAPPAAASTDELEYELFPTTTILDSNTLATMSVDDGSGMLVFSSLPAQLAGVKQGSVLVAGKSVSTPTGLLRMVKTVIPTGQGVKLETVLVPLQFAFRKFHMKAAKRVVTVESGNMTQLPLKPASSDYFTLPFNATVHDADDNLLTTADQTVASGTLGGGYDYTFGIDFDWAGLLEIPWLTVKCFLGLRDECSVMDLLPEFKFGAELGSKIDAALDLQGAATISYKKHIPIANPPLAGFWVSFIYLQPTISVSADVTGKASSSFHIGIGGGAEARMGFSYSTKSGWNPPGITFDKHFESTSQDVTIAANGHVGLNVELGLKVYTLAGPTIGLTAFTELNADQNADPCWDLKAGLDLTWGFELGADFPIFGEIKLINVSDEKNLYTATVAQGQCALPPNGGPVVPGSGPTTETYANPTFQKWAHAFTGATRGTGNSMVDGIIATKFHRGIDGNFTLASHDASSLLKITDAGNLVWAKEYWNANHGNGDKALVIPDTVSLGDATMLAITYPSGIIKIGQTGGVHWAKDIPLPDTTQGGPAGESMTQKTIHASAPDGEGGAWLAGAFVPSGADTSSGFLLRVSSEGQMLNSYAWNYPSRFVLPTVLVPVGDEVIVSGYLWESGERSNGFALRLRKDGTVVWARTLSSGDDVEPTAGIVHSSGDVMLTASYGPYSGLAVRLDDNGDVVTSDASKPMGAPYQLAYHSIAELPTTGFVVTGRYGGSIFMGQLDASGSLMWAQRYQQQKAADDAVDDVEFPSLILQDDGGVVIACMSAIPNISKGSYWVFKPAAKDGSITFTDGSISEAVAVQREDGVVVSAPMAVSITSPNLTMVDKEVVVVVPAITISNQAP